MIGIEIGINILLSFQFIWLSIFNNYTDWISVVIACIVMTLYLLPKVRMLNKYSGVCYLINLIFMLSMVFYYNSYIIFLLISITFEYTLEKEFNIIYIGINIGVISLFLKNFYEVGNLIMIPIFTYSLLHIKHTYLNQILILKKEKNQAAEKNLKVSKKLEVLEKHSSQIEYLTSLRERNNISQKLHDKIGHTIAGSLIQLEAINLMIEKSPNEANNMIKNVIFSLREGMDDIRLTLKDIKPKKMEVGINRIKFILNEFTKKTKIETFLVFKGNIEAIEYHVLEAIINNLEESLTNVIKHSNATSFTVSIEVMNKAIRVEFKDNGSVIKEIERGLGIKGIEERTSTINGKVTFRTEGGFTTNMIIMIN